MFSVRIKVNWITAIWYYIGSFIYHFVPFHPVLKLLSANSTLRTFECACPSFKIFGTWLHSHIRWSTNLFVLNRRNFSSSVRDFQKYAFACASSRLNCYMNFFIVSQMFNVKRIQNNVFTCLFHGCWFAWEHWSHRLFVCEVGQWQQCLQWKIFVELEDNKIFLYQSLR